MIVNKDDAKTPPLNTPLTKKTHKKLQNSNLKSQKN